MFVNFSEETQHLLKQAERQKDELNHPYVGSEHLFLSILKDKKLNEIFKKHKVTYERFRNKLVDLVGVGNKKSEFVLYTPLLKKILENAVIEAREENNQTVNPEILIISILDEEDGIAYSILRTLNVNIDRLYYDIKNKKNNKQIKKKKLLVDELGSNLTKLAKEKRLDPVIGRDKEIYKTIEILLRRKKNNPILIGPAGVGKTAIVEGIANLMATNRCPSFLQNKKIISLNIFSLVSGTKYRGEFEEKMKNLIKELEENEDIILFIDEIHTIVGAGGAEGAIDASNIFKPALARGTIRIIGATTLDEYKKFIEPDAALARRFQCINVEEPDKDNVTKILSEIKPLYEKFHGIVIPNKLLSDIVSLSSRYISNRYEPDRSIDILDEVSVKVSMKTTDGEKRRQKIGEKLLYLKKSKIKALSKNDFKSAYSFKEKENLLMKKLNDIKCDKKIVTKDDILTVIKEKSNVPIVKFNKDRKEFYHNIKNELSKSIIGNEKSIDELIRSLKIRDVTKKKRCYSVLISGPKSTGKSLLAYKYSSIIANEKNIIKLDLSEYKEYHTISKLIGTTAGYLGYDNKNHLFEKIRTNPNSAILIDNFQGACDAVKNLFLRILENGYIEDSAGNKIDFTNCTIIFMIRTKSGSTSVGFNGSKKTDNTLPKELLSKVSLSIALNEPSLNDTLKIISNKIDDIIKRYSDIKIIMDDSYKKKILSIVEKEKNLSNIDSIIEKEFESKIIDALVDYKRIVKFTLSNDKIHS